VWSEVLITAQALRRTVPPRQSRLSFEVWPSAFEIHPPSQPFVRRSSDLFAQQAVTLDFLRIDDRPKIQVLSNFDHTWEQCWAVPNSIPA
jgi:hypothetical protein